MRRFVAGLVALRQRHPSLRRRRFLTGRPRQDDARPDIAWQGADGQAPRWEATGDSCLGFTLARVTAEEADLCVLLNMGGEGRCFRLPSLPGRAWHRVLDTGQPPGADLVPASEQVPLGRDELYLEAHSLVVLEDAEDRPLPFYNQIGILADNPFDVLEVKGVGKLMKLAVDSDRSVKPGLHVGICGEHGGHPESIAFRQEAGHDYASCSIPRIPVARPASPHAALNARG